MSQIIVSKRVNNTDESNRKKFKRSIDISTHWKKIQANIKTNTPRVFECKSKTDCKHLFNDDSKLNLPNSFSFNRSIG